MALDVREQDGRVRFAVRVQPRASRTEIAGVQGNALKVRISAPPVDDAANDQLVRFLADVFGVPRRSIRILAGEHARSKLVEIEGISKGTVHDVATRAV